MSTQIDLRESLNTAIEKMMNARNAYEWLKRNKETSDTQEQTAQFDLFKEVSTVPDILMRCFVIEKGITCYKKKNDGITNEEVHDIQKLETAMYAYNMCSSILFHNSQNPENTYLEDVDFASFFDDGKKVRNLNTHVGVRGVLQDGYRLFSNLNKILLALDCNTEKITVPLSEESEQFDYPKFSACMDDMNPDERIFILITDSLHDADKEELASFLRIPWSLIIDYDGATNYGGLETVMGKHNIPYNKYTVDKFEVNNSISCTPGRILYVALCKDEDFIKQFHANGRRADSRDVSRISIAVNKVRNTKTKATVAVLGSQSYRTRGIIEAISREFTDIDLIYMSRQEEDVIEKTEPEDWEETGNIAHVNQFQSSIFEALRQIHKNRDDLPEREEAPLTTGDAIYYVQVSGVGKIGINDPDQVQKLEQYFEFVHLDIGMKNTENNVWDFFHGGAASWATIRYGNLPVLSAMAEDFAAKIRNNGHNKCYYLYHSPGIGGSTLGKQICFKLSRDMPVLVVKKYSSEQRFKDCLHSLYTHMFLNNPFLLLIDENLFSESEMQDMKSAVEHSDYRVNALFVQRIREEDAKKHYKDAKEGELLFTRLEAEGKEQLKSRCYELLQINGQEYKYQDRVERLEATIDVKDRFAILINLYLLEENFKLDTYVEKFLKRIPQDADGKRMADLLVFTAMGAYFSNNVKFPITYFSQYLSLTLRTENVNDLARKSVVEGLFGDYEEGLLLKRIESGNKWYGIKHYLIAQEMLRQLLGGEYGESWQSRLPVYSKKLIDMLASLSEGRNAIDAEIQSIVTALFTDKTRDREPGNNGDFTALLNAMDEPSRIEIILYLAEKFGTIIKEKIPAKHGRPEYKLLAHIYAQCARVRSKCLLTDEDTVNIEEVDKWIAETENLIFEEDIKEDDLEDMLGRCYLERLRQNEDENLTDETVEETLRTCNRAIDHFSNTIWYGSASYGIPGKLESIWRAIKTIKQSKNWGDEQLIEHLYQDDRAKAYMNMGNELIREADDYEMSPQGQVRMIEERDRFEKTCSPLNPSMLIQNLENLRLKAETNDYNSQYAISSSMVNGYERKYYSKSGEYRRSQLIHRALEGDREAQKDAEKVFEHLDLLVKLGESHEVGYSTYNCWFEYAKYTQQPLTRAWNIAVQWKDKERKRAADSSRYEGNLLRPYYYLFVITFLRYLSNQGMTEQDVVERKEDLKRQFNAKTSRQTSEVRDWFADGKGMGQLFDRSWISMQEVDGEEHIRVVSGRVIHYENELGYLRITNPPAMGRWIHTPVGMSYSKDYDVFYDGRQSNMISEEDVGNGKEKQFKVGFSYEGMVASQKSLERNIKKSTIIKEKPEEFDTKPVVFQPQELKYFPTNMYLNGVLPDGTRGGLNSSDIERFKFEVNEFGGSGKVMELLAGLPSFEVVIQRATQKGYRVSLYDTGTSLAEIVGEPGQEGAESHAPIQPAVAEEEPQQEGLPDPSQKDVMMTDCDFSKGNSISGRILLSGYPDPFPAKLSGIKPKKLKELKNKDKIPVRIIGKNQVQYIVRLR
jgi:hypothetical protein